MDRLGYFYNRDANGNLINNRLRFIRDTSKNAALTDLADQSGTPLQPQTQDNYQYDAIGNLIKDTQAGITGIDWSVYGKIDTIRKNAGNIGYSYDPAGHRISKTANGLTTYYVRDAQGNTLALYDNANKSVNWREQHMYGSRRLGIWTPNVNLNLPHAAEAALAVWDSIGRKYYELTNHLDNVIANITDRRIQIADTSNVHIDHYVADVATAQDYYPFGMLMPGRQYTANGLNYRYGFNSVEKSDEVDGLNNYYEFKYREYDPRTGKFWSVDPLTKNYPWNSSYAFAENRVIDGIDLEGKEWQASQGSDGTTNVSVNVNLTVDKETNLSQNQINAYKKAINAEMNKILNLSSNNKVNGKVTFEGGDQSKINQVIPSLNIYGSKPEPGYILIGGQTTSQYSAVNIYKKDGTIKNPEEFARNTVHELFHTIRLQHPFEVTQADDTRLINVAPNKFITAPGTNPNILYNIMNYSLINIDGKNLGDLWKKTPIRLITPGQINFILKEIHMQMNGAGLPNDKKYDWINFPGYNVKPTYDFLHPFKH